MKLWIWMSVSFFVSLSASAQAAQTVQLEDFLFQLEVRFNQSQTLSELASKTPGTLTQKSQFVQLFRKQGLDQEAPPRVTRVGSTLEFDLRPKLIIDFQDLEKLKVKVNGRSLDLQSSSDWMTDFRSAYQSKVSWTQGFISRAYAQNNSNERASGSLNSIKSQSPSVLSHVTAALEAGLNKVARAGEVAYFQAIATYVRCDQGLDDCPAFSHADTIVERLTKGHHSGLREFQCEKGKLKTIQAFESSYEKKLPKYEFTYQKNSDEILIQVQNFGQIEKQKSTCEFIYNDRTKKIRPKSALEVCQLGERTDLSAIGFNTPVAPAFRCCQRTECAVKVTQFKKSSVIGSAPKVEGQQIPATK